MTDTEESNTVERELTSLEIEQRKTLHLELETERDGNVAEVADMRSQIRALNLSRRRLELRAMQLRREIHSGKVREARPSPQLGLALTPSALDAFYAQYPLARDAMNLHAQLACVLQGIATPSLVALEKWDPSTGIFEAIANWTRVELAHMNATEHPSLALPAREPMPVKLFELRAPMLAGVERAERKAGKRVDPALREVGIGRRRSGVRPVEPVEASPPAASKPGKARGLRPHSNPPAKVSKRAARKAPARKGAK